MNAIEEIDIDTLSMRQKVFLLEDELAKQPQVEMPVTHYFSKGVYARELFIPADTVLTGKIHKYENLNILSKNNRHASVQPEVFAPFPSQA